MEDEDISDAVYGDLGDFEFGERLKEQNEEIASLTERLNQAVVTITDLQNEIKSYKRKTRTANMNTSSLLQTAKVELARKQRDILVLQQKIDNKIFRRRPNNCSVAVQTEPDVTIDPVFHCNVNDNNVNVIEPMQHQQLIQPNNSLYINSGSLYIHNKLTKFRIPKKNPFMREENKHGVMNETGDWNVKKLEDSYDQPRHYMPKKYSYARCLDGDEGKSKVTHVSRLGRKEVNGERTSSHDRRDQVKDFNRRHSPVTHTSSRQRDYKKFDSNSNDQKLHRRNGSKHVRGRSSSHEEDRHSKRYRSDSTSNRHRSRSKPFTVDEKPPKTKSPKNRNSKPGKDDRIDAVKSRNDCVSDLKEVELDAMLDDRIDAVKSRNDCVSDLKEEDLEAMLVAQIKLLDQMNSNGCEQQVGLKENSSPKRRKRKISDNDEAVDKLANDEQSEDPPNSANEAIANVAEISESKNVTDVVEADTVVNQENLNGLYISPENLEAPTVVTNNSNQELPSMEATASVKCLDPFSPLREFFSPATEPPTSTDRKVETEDMPKTNQFQHSENSNSQMDIDYELMERTTSGENQSNLSNEEKNRELLVESSSTKCPIENNDNICESSPTQINVSFIAMENDDVLEKSFVAENSLNSSHERHILSKSSEYVVLDAGHEIRIFLTKKRKKKKISKVTAVTA